MPVVLSLLLLVLCHPYAVTASAGQAPCCYKRLFSFGDSFNDTGNLARADPNMPPLVLPYGETFFHRPAGRSCDGRLIVDFITGRRQPPATGQRGSLATAAGCLLLSFPSLLIPITPFHTSPSYPTTFSDGNGDARVQRPQGFKRSRTADQKQTELVQRHLFNLAVASLL
ncbi:hypothetical protein HU200_011036 [Digitaria exilis]|uniref:GDSL esterase/lipase n=1 Tax=Digitaria exilis TaxID=1010633 RepID=A0A835KPG1_9POAL|nr:hypothetical protein HU200_011036 [Digitaria exilis]